MINLYANWFFENKKYGYDITSAPYAEFYDELQIVLTILLKHEILIPKRLLHSSLDLSGLSISQIIEVLKESQYINNCTDFNIYGDTKIYKNGEIEVHSNVVALRGIRTFQQFFSFCLTSYIFLPLVFDNNKYEYVWNIKHYNLNYFRIPQVLKEVAAALNWSNESFFTIEYVEHGCLQVGYDLLIAPDIMKEKWSEEPNYDFDIEKYLADISQIEKF